MTAIPMRLEDALRFNGYTIEQTDVDPVTITVPTGTIVDPVTLTVPTGTIVVPALRLSSLVWRRDPDVNPEHPWDSFYLKALPMFEDAYRPVILSHILDRYSTRRIGYDTPDQFGLAVRRWMNLQLGPQSQLNRRYLSTAVVLPLDTQDATTADKARDATSDFPQTQLGGNTDYASFATDRVGDTRYTGRLGRSVAELLEEQRTAFLNVDVELLDAMDDLFLGVWDRGEYDGNVGAPLSAIGFLPGHW